MQKHTKIYLDYFSYSKDQPDIIYCEICGGIAQDIHHIDGRGKGKDIIENLIAVCRSCHDKCNTNELTREYIREIHLKRIKNRI